MQLVSHRNIDQYCYCRYQLVYVSLDKINNSKDSRIEEFKPKA